MMYQCGRCGLTRASSQEPMGLVTPQCKCPWEFVPPVAPQRDSSATPHTWVGLSEQERNDLEDYCEMIIGKAAFDAIEAKLKEKNK